MPFDRGTISVKGVGPLALKASGAETVSTTGNAQDMGASTVAHVEVNVTAASGVSPTMTVVIEGSNDGTNWYTLATFGANGAALGAVNTAPTNFTAAAGPIRAMIDLPQQIRYRSVIGGSTPSFTYQISVEAN